MHIPNRSAAFYTAVLMVVAATGMHLLTSGTLGFHRDEFLYLALGRRPDWGYWSNPPMIGWLSWWSQHTLGGSQFALHVLPALACGAVAGLTALWVRDWGGSARAQVFAGTGMLVSIAWQRAFSMFMPVCFDILFWSAALYALHRYFQTGARRWAAICGLMIGLGMLNKYSLVFLAAGLVGSLLLTPRRRLLVSKAAGLAVLAAVLPVLPNLYWQAKHHFPVIRHMRELTENQLSLVDPLNFLSDQLILHGAGLFIWLPGLLALFFLKKLRPVRFFGLLFVGILLLFLALKGKSYYTLGIYPPLFAAGGIFWEAVTDKRLLRPAFAAGFPLLLLGLSAVLLPIGLPVFGPDKLVRYFNWLGLEPAVRWENGRTEALPQDYADRLGWEELAALVDSSLAKTPAGAQSALIYAENYGQAGAIEHLSDAVHSGKGRVVSFADSWLLWAPDALPQRLHTFIYVNDELGDDVRGLFPNSHKAGAVRHPYARERGTEVWICPLEAPDRFREFWKARVAEANSPE